MTEFHKLSGYLSKQSVITFTSEVLSFEYSNNRFSFQWNEGRLNYRRRKTLYILAERNIVSVIPNWVEVNLEFNNTRSFWPIGKVCESIFPKRILSLFWTLENIITIHRTVPTILLTKITRKYINGKRVQWITNRGDTSDIDSILR